MISLFSMIPGGGSIVRRSLSISCLPERYVAWESGRFPAATIFHTHAVIGTLGVVGVITMTSTFSERRLSNMSGNVGACDKYIADSLLMDILR